MGPGTTALDLGCGTGILATAAAVLDTDHVVGVDVDASALSVAVANAERADVEERMDFIQARVKDLSAAERVGDAGRQSRGGRGGRGGRGRGGKGRGRGSTPRASTTQARQLILSDDDGLPLQSNCVDTVLTNPPFGTKQNAGMDLRFLRTATRLARRAVYSFHKTSTRDFLQRQVEQSWGMQFQVVAEMRFDLPQTYKFHQKKSVDIQVDLIRVLVGGEDGDDADDAKEGADASPEALGQAESSDGDESE